MPQNDQKVLQSVSFIIPSYNSFRTIARTLQSILKQTSFDLVREILVVDSSDDGFTARVLQDARHPLVKVVRLVQKTSPALGRNIGAAQATGDVLCFIDSDVELSLDWLERIAEHQGPGLRVGGGSILTAGEQRRNILALAQYYLQFNEFIPAGSRRVVALLPACNLFCERELFLQAGGFPDMRASEDTLFCLRIARQSPVWFLPEAMAYHIFRQEWGGFLRNQEILGRYVMIYRKEHYDSWFYKGVWPVVLLPAFLLIKLGRIALRILRGGPGHSVSFLLSSPVFMLGLCAWVWGFLNGCFAKPAYKIPGKVA